MAEPELDLNKTLDQARQIVTRHRWWVALPAVMTTFATLAVLSFVPNRYTSEATLLVVQQQVPQRYVVPTSTTDIRDALQATTELVLSRNHLLSIIDEFGLYAKQRKRMSPEALLDAVRGDISIQPIESQSPQKDVNSFTISFVANSPQVAQEVTSKLTSLFIEQNLETREHQAITTTGFLREQVDTAKAKLSEAEDQVRTFKMQHLGELPEQQAGNLAIMAGLQTQLQGTMTSLNRAEEQRQYLESLSEYRLLGIGSDLARLKSQRDKMLETYTPEYPGIAKLNEKITQTEATIKTLQAPRKGRSQSSTADAVPSIAFGASDEDISLGQLRGQIEANRLEIENLSKDEKRLENEVDEYQRRLNATPVREQQLAGILRNYEQLKQDYADLLSKESQSQMAADLEKRQEGQQFRVVDRPSLPTVPTSPNRIKVSLGGAAAGIGLGLALAFLMNLNDTSFHSEEHLSQRFALPLVVGVPLLLTSYEQRSRKQKRALEWLAGSGLVLAVLLAQLYEFYLYRHG